AAVKVDWAKLTTTLGLKGNTLQSLTSFRKRHEDALRQVTELKAQPAEVDFAYYRSVLKNQKVIDELEKYAKSFKPVTYDVSKILKTIDAFEAKAVDNAKTTEEKVASELKQLQAALDDIETARPIDQLTVDDVVKARPDIDEKVDEMVIKGKWNIPGYKEKFGSLVIM
ncbi:hypothetical protein CANCADRAFT_22959, partial [Tortispora caseinolytica NRRL Y-17796]